MFFHIVVILINLSAFVGLNCNDQIIIHVMQNVKLFCNVRCFIINFYIRHAKVDGIPVSLWTFVTKMVIIQVP